MQVRKSRWVENKKHALEIVLQAAGEYANGLPPISKDLRDQIKEAINLLLRGGGEG